RPSDTGARTSRTARPAHCGTTGGGDCPVKPQSDSARHGRGWCAAFRPPHLLRSPTAKQFHRVLGIVPRASGVNAALLSLGRQERGLSQAAAATNPRAAWDVRWRTVAADPLRSGTLRSPWEPARGLQSASRRELEE